MIEIRKGFQEHKLIKEYKEMPLNEYETITKIHKYDRQRLKSLCNELKKESNRDVILNYE